MFLQEIILNPHVTSRCGIESIEGSAKTKRTSFD